MKSSILFLVISFAPSALFASTVKYLVEGTYHILVDPRQDLFNINGAKFKVLYTLEDPGRVQYNDPTNAYFTLADDPLLTITDRPNGMPDISQTFTTNYNATLRDYGTFYAFVLPGFGMQNYLYPIYYSPSRDIITMSSTLLSLQKTVTNGVSFAPLFNIQDVINVSNKGISSQVSYYDPITRSYTYLYYSAQISNVSSVPLPAAGYLFISGCVLLFAKTRNFNNWRR